MKNISRKALGRAALRLWRSGLPESTGKSGQATSRRDAKPQSNAKKTLGRFVLLCVTLRLCVFARTAFDFPKNTYDFRLVSNSFKMRLYSSAQLLGWTKPWSSTG